MRKTHFTLHSYALIVLGLIFLINSETWAAEEEQKKSIFSSSHTPPTSELTTAPSISLTDLSKVKVCTSGVYTSTSIPPLTSYEIMHGSHSLLDVTESVLKNPTYYLDKLVEVKIPRHLLKNITEYSVKSAPGVQSGTLFEISLGFDSGIFFHYFFRPRVFFTP